MGRAEIAKQVAQFAAKVPELASLQAGHFRNLVVGGGPAGYATVSTLLDGGSSPTLWVDPVFQSGRLAQYLEVSVPLLGLLSLGCKLSRSRTRDLMASSLETRPERMSSVGPQPVGILKELCAQSSCHSGTFTPAPCKAGVSPSDSCVCQCCPLQHYAWEQD